MGIFYKVVAVFLIVIIPIYALSIYVYNWAIETVKTEISTSTISQVSYYLQSLDMEVERMKALQYDCLLDEDLNKLSNISKIMDTFDIVQSLNRLQRRLSTIKNSSRYIKEVVAYIPSTGQMVSSNSGVSNIDMQKFNNIRIPQRQKGAQIIDYKGGLYISTLQQGGNKTQYMITIELDESVLKNALAQFNTYADCGSFLVNLENSKIIADDSNTHSGISTSSILAGIDKGAVRGTDLVKIQGKGYYAIFYKSEYLNILLVKYIQQNIVLQPLEFFYKWVWLFTIVGLCLIFLFSFSVYKLIHQPLLELVKAFRKVEKGDLDVSIHQNAKGEFIYLFNCFNQMTKSLKLSIDQVYNQKILTQRAQLKQLQSQINPHFLYNSFFMINTMAQVGDENLIPFTKYLGMYYQFVTRSTADNVDLINEVNHAKTYMHIQQMRFSKRLTVNFAECPEKFWRLSVPRLILQPILENSMEYVVEKTMSHSIIYVDFKENASGLDIIVEDNGSNMSDKALEQLQQSLESNDTAMETTGLINIHRRLQLVFGPESGLQVSRSKLGGLKVILKTKNGGGKELCTDC